MPRQAVASSVAGIFPIVSYLHVPKAMPEPNWLMLGSTFVLDKSALKLNPAFAAKHEVLMLTAAHTLAPWRCFKVNIPDEWRKARFVTGKVMQYDCLGTADVSRMCELGVVAVHPTVDVALVKVLDAKTFTKHCADGPKDAEKDPGDADDVNNVLGAFRLTSPTFASDAPDDAFVEASCLGFRGRGKLGDTEALGEEQQKKMTTAERQALVDEHRKAVGKQDFNVCRIRVRKDPPVTDVPPLVPTGEAGDPKAPASSIYSRGLVASGACYAGMSGAPLVLPPLINAGGSRDACGLLFQRGLNENRNTEVLYVPSSAIVPWLESLK
jgi:hypothetical protein